MCVTGRKLRYFSYILKRLIDLHREKVGIPLNISDDEILESFSNTRVMKLLYFVCLGSMVDQNGAIINQGLFALFDNFCAYPRGQVEVDVYDYIENTPAFDYYDGHLQSFKVADFHVVEDRINNELLALIDNGINFLRNHFSSKLFNSTSALIDLSHSLNSWKEAYLSISDNKIKVDNNDVTTIINYAY